MCQCFISPSKKKALFFELFSSSRVFSHTGINPQNILLPLVFEKNRFILRNGLFCSDPRGKTPQAKINVENHFLFYLDFFLRLEIRAYCPRSVQCPASAVLGKGGAKAPRGASGRSFSNPSLLHSWHPFPTP